jgi:iron(III) transport system substrate-binding protein
MPSLRASMRISLSKIAVAAGVAMMAGADGAHAQGQLNIICSVPIPPAAPKMSDIKFINYDFASYGSAAERKRLLDKWDKEVYALPK